MKKQNKIGISGMRGVKHLDRKVPRKGGKTMKETQKLERKEERKGRNGVFGIYPGQNSKCPRLI